MEIGNVNMDELDARDKKIFVDFKEVSIQMDNMFNPQQQKLLRKWLVKVYETVTSQSFNYYHQNDLKLNQAKVFAAKNYLLNITNLMQNLTHLNSNTKLKIYQYIVKQSKNIIDELILKYPQSQPKGGVRKLKKAINRPDNRQNDQYDLLRYPSKTNVRFQYKQSANYAPEIMRALNYIMQITSQPLHNFNDFQTNADGFYAMLQSIFTYAGCGNFQQEFFQQLQNYIQQTDETKKVKQFENLWIQNDRSTKKKVNQFKSKVEAETQYHINQKIPNHVQVYTEEQIQSGLFRVPDVSVLRVMTKWAEQLREKLSNSREMLLKRFQMFKTKDGQLIQLCQAEKKFIFRAAQEQKKKIQKFFDSLIDNCNKIGARLSTEQFQSLYTNDVDANLGIFSSRSQTCIGKYIFAYLNQLMHSLLYIPIKARQILQELLNASQEKIKAQDEDIQNLLNLIQDKRTLIKQVCQKLQSINLISFKIGDLLRAKCKSSEKHIISIFKFISRLSEAGPSLFKIVRVKDRLDGKDNDLLINFFFMKKIQCQIQLSVCSNVDQKQQQFNSFNHFIYELKRAQFGAIAECACIMAQYDPATKSYCQRQSLSPKIQQIPFQPITLPRNDDFKIDSKIQSEQSEQNDNMRINTLPFFCSRCTKFIRNTNPFFYKRRIHTNKIKQCNNCYEDYLKSLPNKDAWIDQLISHKYTEKKQQNFIKNVIQYVNLEDIKDYSDLKKLQTILIIPKMAEKPIPTLSKISYFDKQIYIVSAETKNSQIGSKIIKSLNTFNEYKKEKKKLQNSIILEINQQIIKVQGQNYILQNNNEKIVISNKFDHQNDVPKLKNIQRIRNIFKKQNDRIVLSYRQVTDQLESIRLMPNIKKLIVNNNKIQNLKFLKKLPNLNSLDISYNKITTLEEVRDCLNLKQLKCNQNNIQVISGLQKLNNLQKFEVNGGEIKVISNLQQCINLKSLSIVSCKIQKIQNIQKLIKLERLYLENNYIDNIENLDTLINLKYLNLSNNYFQKIEHLQKLQMLQQLNLSFNNIQKIENIQNLKSFKVFNIQSNPISQIINLNKLRKLKQLYISNQNQDTILLQKIQNLQELPSIKTLHITHGKIQKIQNLEKLRTLNQLNLSYHQIKQINNMSSLKELLILDLSNNQIEKIKNLYQLSKLRNLNLSSNLIKNIKNIKKLACLQVLDLSNNQIMYIKKIPEIKTLKTLKLNNNKIKKIEGLQNLMTLKELNLANNKIQKIVNLNNLHQLVVLNVENNLIIKLEQLNQLYQLKELIIRKNPINKKLIQNQQQYKRLTRQYIQIIEYSQQSQQAIKNDSIELINQNQNQKYIESESELQI